MAQEVAAGTTLWPEPMANDDVTHWRGLLTDYFAGRDVVLAGGNVSGQTTKAQQLMDLGARATFILATEGVGTGEINRHPATYWADNSGHPQDTVQQIRHTEYRLRHLPADALQALNRFDPDRCAIVVGSYHHDLSSVAGRRSLSHRRAEWLGLDDKTNVDAFWDRCGIGRAASVCVPPSFVAVAVAFAAQDRGSGVVLSGDSRDGVSGGAVGTRWCRTPADVEVSLDYFVRHCDRVRVMPFVEGVPCTAYGIVAKDYVATLRPAELVTLRAADDSFFYAGSCTYWDPPATAAAHMRRTAHAAGLGLLREVDYRGLFALDGILTSSGFVPTELNTRPGAATEAHLAGMPGFPLELLCQLLMADLGGDFRLAALERMLEQTSEESRGGGTWASFPVEVSKSVTHLVRYDGVGWHWTEDAGLADGAVVIGPGALGGFVALRPARTTPRTRPFAVSAAPFWNFIYGELDLGSPGFTCAVATHEEVAEPGHDSLAGTALIRRWPDDD